MDEKMTDKQFDKILKMVAMILDGCKDLKRQKLKLRNFWKRKSLLSNQQGVQNGGGKPPLFYDKFMTSRNKKEEPLNFQRFHGGDDGSRTRVRKHFHENFSERSLCFKTSPLLTPKSRL